MKTLLKQKRFQMVQFKVDNGERNREIIEKFIEKSGDHVLAMCLKNRLEYNSRYTEQIENKIQNIMDTLHFEHQEQQWLHLLD